MVGIVDIARYMYEIIVISVKAESGITEHLRCNFLSKSHIVRN